MLELVALVVVCLIGFAQTGEPNEAIFKAVSEFQESYDRKAFEKAVSGKSITFTAKVESATNHDETKRVSPGTIFFESVEGLGDLKQLEEDEGATAWRLNALSGNYQRSLIESIKPGTNIKISGRIKIAEQSIGGGNVGNGFNIPSGDKPINGVIVRVKKAKNTAGAVLSLYIEKPTITIVKK